jgi:hypothetical protein
MPYFKCPRCRLTVYSAAAARTCPECSGPLRRGDRLFVRQDLAQPISRSSLSLAAAPTPNPVGETMSVEAETAGSRETSAPTVHQRAADVR